MVSCCFGVWIALMSNRGELVLFPVGLGFDIECEVGFRWILSTLFVVHPSIAVLRVIRTAPDLIGGN